MSDFKKGQKVKVYGLMNPKSDLKGEGRIYDIAPMYRGGETMLWVAGFGCWHPDACEPLDENMRGELIDEIKETLKAFDEAYAEGMDHEQGYDFALGMRDLLVDILREF